MSEEAYLSLNKDDVFERDLSVAEARAFVYQNKTDEEDMIKQWFQEAQASAYETQKKAYLVIEITPN